jgi:hypothetical protein
MFVSMDNVSLNQKKKFVGTRYVGSVNIAVMKVVVFVAVKGEVALKDYVDPKNVAKILAEEGNIVVMQVVASAPREERPVFNSHVPTRRFPVAIPLVRMETFVVMKVVVSVLQKVDHVLSFIVVKRMMIVTLIPIVRRSPASPNLVRAMFVLTKSVCYN